ncbi:MAG: RnfABCDGE type electron transport complex subunit D [Sedimentisphaerales bacterium]|jgi:electron transport complex protein RnfD|nr:RnfABCDGE type electron transport complex subunit D [Sedimentisphaerales bacterium]
MLTGLRVSHAPHIGHGLSIRRVMLDVVIGLIPAMVAALVLFRHRAALVILVSVGSGLATELACNLLRGRGRPWESLGDLSAVVTGIILAFSLPPALPLWAVAIGAVFAIAIGKVVFGGLGANIFNPAMVGRSFLTACFGTLMTTWTVPATLDPNMPTVSPAVAVDARTQATPLAWAKQAWKARSDPQQAGQLKDKVTVHIRRSLLGEKAGCLGETGSLWLILGGIYLLLRRTITIHIPAAVLASAFVFSGLVYLFHPAGAINPFVHLCSGGLLLGAFFIATDPVTAPITTKGRWLFGAGVGGLTILIRVFGEYPEGVMYAVLLMNAVSPLIDRLCRAVPLGGRPSV